MNNSTSSTSFRLKVIFVPLFLWGILVTVGYSHGDKKHDEAAEPPTVIDTAGQTKSALAAFSVSLDSAYSAIGESYSDVEPILKNSCFDCHGTRTDFPWYHAIPGVKQFMDGHVEESKEHLDLSNGFPFGGHASQLKQLHAIKEEVEEGEMPLFSYRLMHWDKLIEGEDQKTLFSWIDQSSASIQEVYTRYQMPLPESETHDDEHDDDHDDDHDEDDD